MKISAGIFHLECLCLLLNNHGIYGQAETTARFSASNWSKTDPPRFSDCRLVMLYRGVKIQPSLATFLCPDIFCFCLYLNNQQSYGKMEGAGRFSASNWSKTDPPRFSNCS